jgi:putative membrane protein
VSERDDAARDDATRDETSDKAGDEVREAESRRPPMTRWLFPDGEEPDPRFTLANERTFLAWMRTALAFVAGGVGIEALPESVLEPGLRTVAALAAIGTGILLAAGSAVRWLRIERAMRHDKPLPAPSIVPALSAGSILAAVILALVVMG